MGFLISALTAILVIVCVLMIGLILLQRGRGQGLAGAFGVGGMEEALGARAATTAQKLTAILGVAFLVLSVVVGLLRSARTSALPPTSSGKSAPKSAPAPATPAAPAAPAPSGATK